MVQVIQFASGWRRGMGHFLFSLLNALDVSEEGIDLHLGQKPLKRWHHRTEALHRVRLGVFDVLSNVVVICDDHSTIAQFDLTSIEAFMGWTYLDGMVCIGVTPHAALLLVNNFSLLSEA